MADKCILVAHCVPLYLDQVYLTYDSDQKQALCNVIDTELLLYFPHTLQWYRQA